MIKLLGKLPRNPLIALSGGVDSMAVADFVSQTRKVECAFFDHGTETSKQAKEFVTKVCHDRGWNLIIGKIWHERPSEVSQEEYWRNERYSYFDGLSIDIITAHHLDDCVETYVWSTLHGTPKVIPYRRNRVYRPFLLTKKSDLIDWAMKRNVPWIEDQSNKDIKYMRNYIRHNIVPHAFKINPGLHRVVARKVEEHSINDSTFETSII